MAKLTKTFVDKVAPPTSGYAVHWDDNVKGYGLRVSKQGKRMFIVMGRVAGKSVQFSLGSYGTLTEDGARKRAQKVLQAMREGVDPRASATVDLGMKITLQEVLNDYVGRPGKLKESTAAEYRRHVEKTFAEWAQRPIASITRDMVRERHAALMKGGLAGKKAAPASANAAFVTLRLLIRFAIDEYRKVDGKAIITDNPVDALKRHWAKLGTRTERYVDRRVIGAVWNKLHEMRGIVLGYEALASVDLTIFALLTGARRDEMATLTWDRVNIDDQDPSNCWWHLDNRKRGDPIWLPLSSQSVSLLKSRMPRATPQKPEAGTYVFPSWGKNGRIMDARAPMQAVSEIAGKHLSLHDLRRTFTNIAMRECLIEKFRTDLLTGHKPAQADTTARNYLDLAHLDWLVPDVQKVADWIEQQAAFTDSKKAAPLNRA